MALTKEEKKKAKLEQKERKLKEKEAKKLGISLEELEAQEQASKETETAEPVEEVQAEEVAQQEELVEEPVEEEEVFEKSEEELLVEKNSDMLAHGEEAKRELSKEETSKEELSKEEPSKEEPSKEETSLEDETLKYYDSLLDEKLEKEIDEALNEEETEDVKEELDATEDEEEELDEEEEEIDTDVSDVDVSIDTLEEDEENQIEADPIPEVLLSTNKKTIMKLQTSSPRVQLFYSNLRNLLTKFNELRFKSTNSGDTYAYKGKVVLKVCIFPKALKVYFALDPVEFNVSKYHHKDVSKLKRYEAMPLLLRISSDRSYKYALDFVNALETKYELTKNENVDVDYFDALKTTSRNLLINNKGAKLLRDTCTKAEANDLPDSLAKKCIMYDIVNNKDKEKNVCELSIGELSAAFNSNYIIDLDLLKAVGLAQRKDNYLKITSKNTCYHAITIKANEFEDEACKMIILTGGSVYKLIK